MANVSSFFLSSVLDATAASSVSEISGSKDMRKVYDFAHLTLPTLYGYFWDIEEVRHQEHLHRVSHAQYLYKHRHDSSEAARIYKSFMEEQNQWINEQERIKEMESRLSMKAYQQRTSRWEEDWKRLEESRIIDDIPKKTNSRQLHSVYQQGPGDILLENYDSDDLLNSATTSQTMSSLRLPDPLSNPGSSELMSLSFNDSHQQVDGAQSSSSHNYRRSRHESETLISSVQFEDSRPESLCYVHGAPTTQPVKVSRANPHSSSQEIRQLSGMSKNIHEMDVRSPPNERFQASVDILEVESPALALNSNFGPYNSSSMISHKQDHQKQYYSSSLSDGEVLRIIEHKPWRNKKYLYLILWRPHSSGVPTESWVRAIDFSKSEKKVTLEEYHRRYSLGPVRWPRDPRRQWRSSTSLGVQELQSALKERKQMLLDRGVDELEATRQMSEERWKMRNDWQRAGRGWGSALMVVEDRKKAWDTADSDIGETQSTSTTASKNYSLLSEKSDQDSSDHIAMAQAASIVALDMAQDTLKQFSPRCLPDASLLPSSTSTIDRSSSNSKPDIDSSTRLKGLTDEPKNEFAVTSEDEREWKEHFMPEPIESRELKLSRINTENSGISRVRSTLHEPSGANLQSIKASALPELHERMTNLMFSQEKRPQNIIKSQESESPKPVSSTPSEAQSYLKTQRKKLLSRLLSRSPFKRESHRHSALVHESNTIDDSSAQLTERSQTTLLLETGTKSFGDLENQRSGNQLEQSRVSSGSSSSYVSFDGANSSFKVPENDSWSKTVWDKFSHLLISSSRSSSLKDRKRRERAQLRVDKQLPAREMPKLPTVKFNLIRPKNILVKIPTVSTAIVEERGGRDVRVMVPKKNQHKKTQPAKNQEVKFQRDLMSTAGPSTPHTLMIETPESRTASWAASLTPISHMSKPEQSQRERWTYSSTDGEDLVTKMVFIPSRTDTAALQEPGFSEVSLEITSGSSALSDQLHLMENPRGQNKVRVEIKSESHTPASAQSGSLTRTHSRQQYLANREAKREARRNKNTSKTKYKARKMKEKADQQSQQFKRLNILHSKKACPFGKWSKRDQVELELLRMKLGLRGAKNSWKKSDLGKLKMADLHELREALLPTARVASQQPKGNSPV